VEPADLDLLPELLARDPAADMATLAIPITRLEDWRDPNRVKVVCDSRGRALYFSRSPIPYVRDDEPQFAAQPHGFLQHLGLYAYRREFLQRLANEPPGRLEQMEKLEQLRALALGNPIQVGIVHHASVSVDTLGDYELFVRQYRQSRKLQAA
jgi:3-deoxy-manno-octulosonate cytidylyltransferase (CMP-KDO synthetase)